MIKNNLIKISLCNIIFLILILLGTYNINLKNKIYNQIYTNNINFSSFKKIYQKYLGGVTLFKTTNFKEEKYVFIEKITYKNNLFG